MDQNDNADPSNSQESDPSFGSGSTTSKLRDKLQKLAKWRIDSSSIEFPEDGPEFRGRFATVSQAFFISTFASKSSAEDLAQTGGENESDGGTSKRKAIAVKQLEIESGKDKERVLRAALREAGFLTELSHANVIKLEGFVEDLSEGRVWLVFPWAANGDLKGFVAAADWEIPERICLIHDVASGLEYLHTRGPPIYHGDLKSANVLVNSNSRAVITNFGSARPLMKKDPPVQPEKSKKAARPALLFEAEFCEATNTVTLKGNQSTFRWAAPELFMEDEPGMEPGLWSDIWALGWIFYEVMTNSIPFQNARKDSFVIRVIQGNLPSAPDHVSMVMIRALYSLMVTAWNIDPSKRPNAEDYTRSLSWMPMMIPDLQALNSSGSRARSPELLAQLGNLYKAQNDHLNASRFFSEALDIYRKITQDALNRAARSPYYRNETNPQSPYYSSTLSVSQPPSQPTISSELIPSVIDAMNFADDIGRAITWISASPINTSGHFCDLFEGMHLTAGKVALKRPRIGATGYNDVIVRRFEREAATWRNLRHPHILEFFGTFERDGHLYFVSPFIKNGTLVEYIADYPDVNRIKLMCETADAVQYLHKEGIVHGDLKAKNILIDDKGSSLLCDFGLTKSIDSRTSTAMRGGGTFRWQSPELWENAPKTFESDVYAFSMTIVEVLTSNVPFADYPNDVAVMRAVLLSDERPSKIPTESSNGISYEVIWEVAAACWQREPADRLSMSEALERIRADPSLIENPM